LKNNEIAIQKLGRISAISYNTERPELAASGVVQGIDLFIPLAELIDVDVEKNRLEKEITRLEGQLVGLTKKLSNENFVSRAPQDVVDKEKQKKEDWETNLGKLKASLQVLLGQ
jgi:valyl-tRNA synthetase